MMSIRLRPLRRVLVAGLVVITMTLLLAFGLAAQLVGRRDNGALPRALTAAARLEATRLETLLAQSHQQANTMLGSMLAVTSGFPSRGAVPWVGGGCAAVRPVPLVVQSGVWDEALGAPVMLLDWSGPTCVDTLGAQSLAARLGPPFPAPRDVSRLAQMARLGTQRATGELQLVAAWRDGVKARWRLARADRGQVAFVDVDVSRLPGPQVLEGIRLDSLVVSQEIPTGYIHGGPDENALGGALAGVKQGVTRALDLPDLAHLNASVAVLAWLQPQDADGGHFALGAASVTVATSPVPVTLSVVASTPWPLKEVVARQTLAVLWVLLALLWMVLVEISTRALASGLWKTAQATREAWLGLRDDDVGSAQDLLRARTWMDAVARLTEETLVAALGHAERFWAPAPMTRLLKLLKDRLDATRSDDTKPR